MRFGPLLAGVLLVLYASTAAAQSVSVEFRNGQVDLRAQNAPVRAILAEWARRGGATIVNGERIAGAPVTLELTGIPERQALDILLRSVAGYMLAPRRAGTTGASMFDRIHILPTSVAPRVAGPTPAPPPTFGAARPRPPIVRQPTPVPVPAAPGDEDADTTADEEAPDAPAGARPAPPRIIRPGIPPQTLGPEPQVVMTDDDSDQEPASEAPATTTPANPFGVPFGSSGRPGVVTPVPQQQQPRPQGQQR